MLMSKLYKITPKKKSVSVSEQEEREAKRSFMFLVGRRTPFVLELEKQINKTEC